MGGNSLNPGEHTGSFLFDEEASALRTRAPTQMKIGKARLRKAEAVLRIEEI